MIVLPFLLLAFNILESFTLILLVDRMSRVSVTGERLLTLTTIEIKVKIICDVGFQLKCSNLIYSIFLCTDTCASEGWNWRLANGRLDSVSLQIFYFGRI